MCIYNLYQTFQSVCLDGRLVHSLPVLVELLLHGADARLHINLETAAREHVGVDLRVREDPITVVGDHGADVPVAAGVVVGRGAAGPPDGPLQR